MNNRYIQYQCPSLTMWSPYASIKSTTSSFTETDSMNTDGSYSIQFNMNDQANGFYLQAALLVHSYTSNIFHVEVFAYGNSTHIEDYDIVWQTSYNPMQYNAQVVIAYNPATKVVSLTLVNPSGVAVWTPTQTITHGVVPNIADLDVLGYGNGSSATFSGFTADAQLHTGDSHTTSIYNWTDPSMAPSNLCNQGWNWSVEATNLGETNGTGSYNFFFSYS
jgi:hypothetical protein